jgi:hypothetical protein
MSTEDTSATPITPITPIEGGWRIHDNLAGTHWVDVLAMLYNYRIVLTPKAAPYLYVAHWCYSGKGRVDLMRTVVAAMEWDGTVGTEPVGWNKNGQTGEWRSPT